jgi:hypothetical protein
MKRKAVIKIINSLIASTILVSFSAGKDSDNLYFKSSACYRLFVSAEKNNHNKKVAVSPPPLKQKHR